MPGPLNRLDRSPLHGSVVALALTVAALLISQWLRPYLEPDIFLLFVVAVWLSAWYYGRIMGLLATGASAFALLYFFIGRSRPRCGPVGARLGAFLVIALPDHLGDRRVAGEPADAGLDAGLSIGDAVVATRP